MDRWKVRIQYDPDLWGGVGKLTRTFPPVFWPDDGVAFGRTEAWPSWSVGRMRLPW